MEAWIAQMTPQSSKSDPKAQKKHPLPSNSYPKNQSTNQPTNKPTNQPIIESEIIDSKLNWAGRVREALRIRRTFACKGSAASPDTNRNSNSKTSNRIPSGMRRRKRCPPILPHLLPSAAIRCHLRSLRWPLRDFFECLFR